MSLTRKWSLLAAVLVVAIFAAGWFLLIAPKRTEANDLKTQAATQERDNAALVQKLAELKAQQAELPQQRAKLAVFRTQIPDNPALPSLVRNLTAAGRQVGAHIDELTPATPVPVVDPTAPVAAPVTSAAGSGTEATTETPAAAPVAAAPTALLYEVPLGVKVSGSYFELEQFVNKLEKLKRSFLVSGFTVEPLDDTDVPAGTLQIAIEGKVFLAPEVAATATQPTPVTATSK